ncbi:MAG TPA: SGNH/GDSL hydrolase family protein [bacterium]|nr:SGNH/GDSL hydrolase family protein [bacterium]HQP99635.1 SGNH/GDSL hydrolase family protein [bacterium]
MKITRFLFPVLVLSFMSSIALGQEDLRWIDFPDPAFEVNGLYWFRENKPDLFRFPKRAENLIPKAVWSLAKDPSGGRIRFKSDCTALGIRLEYPRLSDMRNMHAFGQSGVDLYIDGVYGQTAVHQKETTVEHIYFPNAFPGKREYVLYLPIYNGVSVKAIGVNPDAVLEKPRPFALPKPVVFYGTSITQGGCASRSGMSYSAILCRKLNLDFVNLGFSGNGKGEKEVAELVAEIDAACFVLDFMANNKTAASVSEVYEPFLRILRAKHPDTPIIAITLTYVSGDHPLSDRGAELDAMRDVIRAVVAKKITEGDKNLMLVEGHDLLGPECADGLVDGTHPNDLGFQVIADHLAPTLAQVLKLPQPK